LRIERRSQAAIKEEASARRGDEGCVGSKEKLFLLADLKMSIIVLQFSWI